MELRKRKVLSYLRTELARLARGNSNKKISETRRTWLQLISCAFIACSVLILDRLRTQGSEI